MTLKPKERIEMKSKAIAAISAGAFALAATAALAGECPAGKRVADGQGHRNAGHGPKAVTDDLVAWTDLGAEKVGLKEHRFRARRLVIQPGGIVPWHSHDERPAMIYVVRGEIYEYASNCAAPILHAPGEVAREAKGTSHWWQNTGKAAAELIAVDILPPQMKKDDKMM
jgi:quercetin dioxygenase-like cupin family protein